jgi:hypothetical protein
MDHADAPLMATQEVQNEPFAINHIAPIRPVRTLIPMAEMTSKVAVTVTLSSPNLCDMLKTVHRYLEDFNDPIARNMEALFMSFNMMIRSDESRGMRSTAITDFFHRS